MPKRIQRKRTAGWRKPEGSVIVDRTSRWGNPFTVFEYGRAGAVKMFEACLTAKCVSEHYRLPFTVEDAKRELRGKDLVCFCKLSEVCHGDVLLKVASEE